MVATTADRKAVSSGVARAVTMVVLSAAMMGEQLVCVMAFLTVELTVVRMVETMVVLKAHKKVDLSADLRAKSKAVELVRMMVVS